ncbi:hypothetical protein MMC21_008132 [Puttea exsequens]|nr:hypothetical protein [Puttea exsequens]
MSYARFPHSSHVRDETPSTLRFDALPDVLDPSTPRCHAPNVLDKREPEIVVDKDRNEPISSRHGARRALSPIIVPPMAMAPPLPQARERAQTRRVSKNVQAGPSHRISSAAIERVLPTCTTDHAPVANPLEAHRSKRRRLGSDTASPPEPFSPEPEVHTTPMSNPTGNSTCRYPPVLYEGGNTCAVDTVPPDIASKINRVGSAELLEELWGNFFRLRTGARRRPLTPNHETGALCIRGSLETRGLYEVARALSNLRNELEVAEMGE